MNAPLALPAHTVTLLLSYIARLDDGLPPHLIATPLRQRHLFLGLGRALDTTQDAVAYLTWPSASESDDDRLRVVSLLNGLPSPENFDPLIAYPTKYSFDGETFFAHAQIPADSHGIDDLNGLRLVFRWEADVSEELAQGEQGSVSNVENWRYLDIKPMPFPPNSHNLPHEALRPVSTSSAESTLALPGSARSKESATITSDSDDDAYWNAYGRSNSDDEDEGPYNFSRSTAKAETDDEKAEEAYWAQYASVHGSADSTRPSPLPQRRRLHDPSQPVAIHPSLGPASYFDKNGSHESLGPDEHQSGASDPYVFEHIEYLHHFFTGDGRESSPEKGALSPADLSHRLHNLSPRLGFFPLPAPEKEIVMDSSDPESPDTSDGQTVTPPGHAAVIPGGQVELAHSSLHETIKGVYKLWSASRNNCADANDAHYQKEEFINIVRETLKCIQ